MADRRFPPPWSIDEANNACFFVRDSTGQALGYFYFEGEPGRRSAAKLLTKDETRRMAANIAKLPGLWHSARDANGLQRERRVGMTVPRSPWVPLKCR